MYTIAPRVGSRCQFVCGSCLNVAIRRGENASPRLLRQNSTVAAATHNAENEFSKAEPTSSRSLASWLQQAANKAPKPAQEDQADNIATPLNRSSSTQRVKLVTKKRSKAAQASQDDKKADTLKPSISGKIAQAKKKNWSKRGQVDSDDQTRKPLKTSSSKKSLPGTDKKLPPGANKGIVKTKIGEKQGGKISIAREAQDISNDKSPPLPSGERFSGVRRVEARRVSPRIPVRISRVKTTRTVPWRAPNTMPIRPARTRKASMVPGRQNRRRGPLLTYLYSITSTFAGRVAKRVLMKILKQKKLLNSHGLRMAAQGGEDIFRDAARKELETTDQTLSTTLLKTYETLESALKPPSPAGAFKATLKEGDGYISGSIHTQELQLAPVEKPQPPVPGLVCGLERVLFNQGVYRLRDPHTRVYNFDPYLESITPVKEFDYNALKEYITSSRDKTLIETAVAEGSKYTGSTSSMTSALAHFHYLLSKWRPVNHGQLSRSFPQPLPSFSAIQRAPAAIFLRRRDGVYAIDANKGFDTSNVLQWLGKSMEKFLTLDKEEYMKYRKEHSHTLTEDDKNSPESYHYTTFGDFLMRSQLDAHDPRLPGTGMYDLKTRAVVSIRRDATDFEEGLGYEITSRHGDYDSYEREYYDMARSAFLKYSLQVRMGRMDGIFVAYHNTERIFGFQYISLPELDQSLHGSTDTTLGDSEFKVSLGLLNKVLDRATEKFPGESLEVQFETRPKSASSDDCFMYIFARPVTEDDIQATQDANIKQIQEYERRVIGLGGDGQEEAIRTAIESAAEATNADDQNELLEAAFNRLDEPASEETIRKAFGTVEKGTPAEKALNKMLDLVAARAEHDDAEVMVSDAGEAVPNFSGEKADTAGAEAAPDWSAPIEDNNESPAGRLVVFKLNIRNFVNGKEVLRPNNLKSTDNWKVDYSLHEMGGKTNDLFKASLGRRGEVLGRSSVPSSMRRKGGSDTQSNVSEGKKYRAKMDRLDEEHGVEVYDKQEFLNFESLEKREAEVRKDVQEEIEELNCLKEAREQAVKV
ncbi:hypothetical protein V493_04429 [Pseudogymnoascus sp. VKM F-4281 (FW-2241)]|nr:hypothetical protein V493_04429 [Pseudogymnoascus sp. VKM F-4281 (FW-2241)]